MTAIAKSIEISRRPTAVFSYATDFSLPKNEQRLKENLEGLSRPEA